MKTGMAYLENSSQRELTFQRYPMKIKMKPYER